MKKTTFVIAILASLGCAGITSTVSAAPGAPVGVTGPDAVTNVQMGMERRMMRRGMERRMMRRSMERRMMERRMMKRRMMMRGMRRM